MVNEQESNIINAENKINKQKEDEKIKIENLKKKEADLLVETRTFTPVTKENFNKWFEDFIKETKKVDKDKLDQEKRLSGREFYLKLKNQNIGGAEEFEKEGEDIDYKKREEEDLEEDSNLKANKMCFDKDAFNENLDENLDEIDFDEGDENNK